MMARPTLTIAVWLLAEASFAAAQEPAADIILSNGKIITVDDRFTIARAVAIRGDPHYRRWKR